MELRWRCPFTRNIGLLPTKKCPLLRHVLLTYTGWLIDKRFIKTLCSDANVFLEERVGLQTIRVQGDQINLPRNIYGLSLYYNIKKIIMLQALTTRARLCHNSRLRFASLKDLLAEDEFVQVLSPQAQVYADKLAARKAKAHQNYKVQVSVQGHKKKFTMEDLQKSQQKFTDRYQVQLQAQSKQPEKKVFKDSHEDFMQSKQNRDKGQQQYQQQIKKRLAELEKESIPGLEYRLGLEQMEPQVDDITDLRLSPAGQHAQLHLQAIQDRRDENEKTIKTYLKGEKMVSTVDLPLEMQAEVLNEVEHMKDQVDQVYHHIIDPENAPLLESHPASGWRDIQQAKDRLRKGINYEADQIKYYPGSAKGMEPHQDPLHYMEWYSKNVPKDLRDTLLLVDQDAEEPLQEAPKELMVLSGPQAMLEHAETQDQVLKGNFYKNVNEVEQPVVIQNFQEEDKLPVMPAEFPLEMNAFYEHMEKWALFRVYPQMRLFHKLALIVQAHQTEPESEFDPQSPELRLSSVYTYFNLLPSFVRENQQVINTANCLEFSQHGISYDDKMKALNYVATFALELDDYTKSAVKSCMYTKEDALTKQENYLMDKWVDEGSEELFVHNEQNLLDKARRLDLESGLEEVGEWQEPEYLVPDAIEEPLQAFPAQYYDNEDGFWDNYIAYKERLYSHADVLYARPFFKH